MSTSLGPLYVKHSVLGATRHDTLLANRLCMSVNAVIPGHVRGARQVRGLWEIQAKTAVARDRLLQNSGGLGLKSHSVICQKGLCYFS